MKNKNIILIAKNKFINLFKWTFNNCLSIAALFIAILAFNKTNEQFEINSKNSEIQFEQDLKFRKAHFDSLNEQLEIYKRITNTQLNTIKELLKISQETLKSTIYANRPILSLYDIKLLEDDLKIENKYTPKIEYKIKNQGNRSCYNLRENIFLILPNDINNPRTTEEFLLNELLPNQEHKTIFLPKIPEIDKTDFFFFIKLSYDDVIINKNHNQEYYFHYFKLRDEYNFYICNPKEQIQIDKLLKIE